jgi:hypothetical protein
MRKLWIIIFVAAMVLEATMVNSQSTAVSASKPKAKVMRVSSDALDIPNCFTRFETQMEFCRFLLDYALANCDAGFRKDRAGLKECETISIDMFGAFTTANVNALMRCQGIYD